MCLSVYACVPLMTEPVFLNCFSWSISWSIFCEMLKQVPRGKIGLCSNHVWALFSMLFTFSPPNYAPMSNASPNEHQWITWNRIGQILWFGISQTPVSWGWQILVSDMESFSESIEIQMANNNFDTLCFISDKDMRWREMGVKATVTLLHHKGMWAHWDELDLVSRAWGFLMRYRDSLCIFFIFFFTY